jgi:hypothetical protein
MWRISGKRCNAMPAARSAFVLYTALLALALFAVML